MHHQIDNKCKLSSLTKQGCKTDFSVKREKAKVEYYITWFISRMSCHYVSVPHFYVTKTYFFNIFNQIRFTSILYFYIFNATKLSLGIYIWIKSIKYENQSIRNELWHYLEYIWHLLEFDAVLHPK